MAHSGRNRRFAAVAALTAALALTPALAACSGGTSSAAGSSSTSGHPTSEQKVAPAAVKQPAKVAVQPADGTQDVSPTGQFQVTVADGSISSVALANPEGKQVNGTLSADKKTWTVAEPLGYGKDYTWSGSAVGADGKEVPITGTFHTVAPTRKVGATLNVGDDQTYGIAMPISVQFTSAVPDKDKAVVQKALVVQTSVPTDGAWAWLSDSEVHWRPKEYWKPGTKVTLNARLYGTPFGNGAYGLEDMSAAFTIGRAEVVTANTQTHRFVVTRDGQQVFDFPASYGLDSDPGRVTHNGIHVVISKAPTVSMSNPKYGYKDVVVPWGVQISYNGEYVHGYAPSIPEQGNSNVSHGCANLSPDNAKTYYDQVLTGDPVEVTGSRIPLSEADGTYYDWALDWNAWLAKTAN